LFKLRSNRRQVETFPTDDYLVVTMICLGELCIGSRFGGKEIRDSSRIYTRNPSHRKWGNGSATVAFIPFGPGGPIENPRCRVIQGRNEIGIAEVLADDFNVLIRSIGHRVGEKPQREFKCLFWRPKPEDALRSTKSSSEEIIAP